MCGNDTRELRSGLLWKEVLDEGPLQKGRLLRAPPQKYYESIRFLS